MDRSDFYRLTWWEWGMKVLRIHELRKNRLEDRELTIEMTRQFMALYINSLKGKGSIPTEPQDIFMLSYDNNVKEEDQSPKSTKEVKERLGSKFKKDGK